MCPSDRSGTVYAGFISLEQKKKKKVKSAKLIPGLQQNVQIGVAPSHSSAGAFFGNRFLFKEEFSTQSCYAKPM